jgi:myo-inositol-1(or 4)-monophosphatase
MDTSPLTVVAIQAALKAGEILRRGFQTRFQVASKPGIHNLVTEYDTAAEKSIISTILHHYPSHSILAEESGETRAKQEADRESDRESKVLWIIDPLDGTVNFAHQIPVFSVSIAVAVHKEVQIGVIYNPLLHELFVAEKAKGAYLNGERLTVSSADQLIKAFMATGFPYNVNTNPMHCIDRFAEMQAKGIPIRRLGSAALDLAYVAAGRFDAFWELNLSAWDMAAGKLLVEEAGGKATQYDGSNFSIFSDKMLLATNGHLHGPMIEHLNREV